MAPPSGELARRPQGGETERGVWATFPTKSTISTVSRYPYEKHEINDFNGFTVPPEKHEINDFNEITISRPPNGITKATKPTKTTKCLFCGHFVFFVGDG